MNLSITTCYQMTTPYRPVFDSKEMLDMPHRDTINSYANTMMKQAEMAEQMGGQTGGQREDNRRTKSATCCRATSCAGGPPGKEKLGDAYPAMNRRVIINGPFGTGA